MGVAVKGKVNTPEVNWRRARARSLRNSTNGIGIGIACSHDIFDRTSAIGSLPAVGLEENDGIYIYILGVVLLCCDVRPACREHSRRRSFSLYDCGRT